MLYNQNVDKYKILEVDIMAKFSYQPKGVCSVQIDFEVEDGVVRNVHFTRLKGTNCNGRGTSCPDQLAIALEQSKNM